MTPTNQSSSVWPRARSRKKMPVVITLPISTMNMTGLRHCSARVELRERVADRGDDDVAREDAAGCACHQAFCSLSSARLSSSTLTPGSPRKPSERPSVLSSISCSTARAAGCADGGDAARLELGVGRRDVRVDARARRRHRVDGDVADRRAPGCTGRSSLRIAAAAAWTFLARSGFVGPRFANVVRAGVVGGRGRRGARVEVARARELLRGELGADDLAVARDQAAVRLVLERDLREARS